MVSMSICNKGILQCVSQILGEGGTAVVTNNVNICYQNKSAFCCKTEAVQWDRERWQRSPNEFISLFYNLSCNTKLKISLMNRDLHGRCLKRLKISKALLVKSFFHKPWHMRLSAGWHWGWELWNLAVVPMAPEWHLEKCMATWTQMHGAGFPWYQKTLHVWTICP